MIDERIESAIEEVISERCKESFVELMAGNWLSDIKLTLNKLRDLSNDKEGIDYFIFYLFLELISEGKISFDEVIFSEDEENEDVEVIQRGGRFIESEHNTATIYSWSKISCLDVKLNDI